jgi:hypothetical protein
VSVRVPRAIIDETFGVLRACGGGRRECQALWLSPWREPDFITRVIHSRHAAQAGGFCLDDSFINELWLDLARTGTGVRVQVHTHPGTAFHSQTDDKWPVVHTPGFLSLVIPKFALGPVGLSKAYLVEIDGDGRWREKEPAAVIEVVS